MGKNKKLIAAVIVFMAALFCLYSQNKQSEVTNIEETISLSESSISLDGNTDSSNTSNYKGVSTAGVFFKMIVSLIIVAVLIYGVLWFIRKKTNVVKTDDEYLRRAAYINIAPGKSVEVITLIDKAYLIGVTEDNITLLGEINDEELIHAMNLTADKNNNTKKPASFTEVLDMFLVKGNKQKNIFADTETNVDNLFNKNRTEEE